MLVIPLAVLQDSILAACNRAVGAKLTLADPMRVATKRAGARVVYEHPQLLQRTGGVLDTSASAAGIGTTRWRG